MPSLSDGVYPVSASTDGQDNTVTATVQLTVDTTAPTVTIDSGQLPATIAADTTLTGTYSDANISTVVVTLTGADNSARLHRNPQHHRRHLERPDLHRDPCRHDAYTVTTTATDLAATPPPSTAPWQLTISTLSVTVAQMIAYTGTPVLTGTVASTHSTVGSVTVIVNGQSSSQDRHWHAPDSAGPGHSPADWRIRRASHRHRLELAASPMTPPPTN